MLVLGLADGNAGDAFHAVTAGRDERSNNPRLGLENLDDLLNLPAHVVGGVEVELEEAGMRESPLLDSLCPLPLGGAGDTDRLEVFLGDRVAVVIASGEGRAQPADLAGELIGADGVDQVGQGGCRRCSGRGGRLVNVDLGWLHGGGHRIKITSTETWHCADSGKLG